MKFATAIVLAAALAAVSPGHAQGGAPRAADGLVAVESRQLDEVAVRPGADLAAYRGVLVEPARASLRKDWLKDLNRTRGPARWLTQDDAQQIVDDAVARLSAAVAAVFGERGYAIAKAPAAGVLRLAPAATELDVYAPDAPAPGIVRYYQRDAGQATLTLEARDSVSGALLLQIVDRGTAQEIYRVNRATEATNAFWFNVLFRRWATACADVLSASAAP
jgi:hypothetical protein